MATVEPRFRSLPRDERRDRIVRAAKRVLLDRGWEATNMDAVAAGAGTTKPTVYAHFGSKDELFAAVAGMVQGLLRDELRTPDAYADEPAEAVALFCGRHLELVTWADAVALQRAALSAAAAGSPTMARAVHEAMFAEPGRSLAAYLRRRKLAPSPVRTADLILSATAGGPVLRHLFGADDPRAGLPDPAAVGARVDLRRVRGAVRLILAR